MITWKDLNNALGALVSQALKDAGLPAERDRQDVSKPVVRRSYRIDLTTTDGMGTDDYAETGADVEIYFYPANSRRPRDEVQEAAQALRCALRPRSFASPTFSSRRRSCCSTSADFPPAGRS